VEAFQVLALAKFVEIFCRCVEYFFCKIIEDVALASNLYYVFERLYASILAKSLQGYAGGLLGVKRFIIQKKDGTRIGVIHHFLDSPHHLMELACWLVPSESKKGYGTEATQLTVDYLFLSKEIARIQAIVDVRNKASQRVLEKVGFQREGTVRDGYFNRGEWRSEYLYGILRREWKEPKILTRTP
jgi:RimJ/RimL family protein N-acetyltransferase